MMIPPVFDLLGHPENPSGDTLGIYDAPGTSANAPGHSRVSEEPPCSNGYGDVATMADSMACRTLAVGAAGLIHVGSLVHLQPRLS